MLDKQKLNSVLTGLSTGKALAREALESVADDQYLDEECRKDLIESGEYDMSFIQEAIDIIEEELKTQES